ncbi:MAG: hypothetical protein PUE84_06570, partial [Firmicutes bacterium]|nr:hypothetical protein [Bacillota bacterium]
KPKENNLLIPARPAQACPPAAIPAPQHTRPAAHSPRSTTAGLFLLYFGYFLVFIRLIFGLFGAIMVLSKEGDFHDH